MLTVVEDEQKMGRAGEVDHAVGHRCARGRLQLESSGEGLPYQLRLVKGGKVRQPDAVRVIVDQGPGDLKREGGLAAAARADDSDQAPPLEEGVELLALGVPPDQGGYRRREVVWGAFVRPPDRAG